MANKNLSQSPLPDMKEVNTWEGVADIDKSDIACRYGEDNAAHHVEGDEWVTGAVAPQDMHSPISMRWTWPTKAIPIRFGR